MALTFIQFLYSKTPDRVFIKILIIVALLFIIVLGWNKWNAPSSTEEGFEGIETSEQKYTLKRNDDIYDDFYAKIYGKVQQPPSRIEMEITTIFQITQPSDSSIILDVGSGNGKMVQSLKSRGFSQVYGIDKSEEMVESCEPAIKDKISCSNVLETMQFEPEQFSHILCLYNTFYEIDDKFVFFRNCYRWLKSGGTLVVHLIADSEHNDDDTPTNKPALQIAKNSSTIETPVFTYDKKVDIDIDIVFIQETFVDKKTKGIRKNEQTLTITPIKKVVNDALYCGFIVQGKTKINYGMAEEYLYFFQK